MRYSGVYRVFSHFIIFLLLLSNIAYSQVDKRVHDRGMLHETVYNTGTIGKPWQYGSAGEKTDLPSMEWPSRSKTVVGGIEYSGQHNIIGAGIYVSANVKGRPGRENRIYAGCGGIGSSSPEMPFGKWSFPISIEEIENFPLIPDPDGHGILNPDYDPDKAEEIIIAKWATPTAIQVTRKSRAWSYPDFDDMIIYEYEFEHTGDTDGRPETIERDTTLHDVLIHFQHGFAPSMFGIQRNYGSWNFDSYSRGDALNFYDPDYWLGFDMVMRTTAADEKTRYLAAHPEPNKDYFREWSETGKNGGGLLSPQAPGFCFLYYDTEQLAIVDTNTVRNESERVKYLKGEIGNSYELDENDRIKQPWNYRCPTGNARSAKMFHRATNMDERWLSIYDPEYFTQWPNSMENAGYPAPAGEEYLGRGGFSYTQAWNGCALNVGFGPYTLEYGDKFSIVMAEVIGYGATTGKKLLGGQTSQPFTPTAPSWNKEVIIDGEVMTEHYLDVYGYPDYVNSDVITVNQVAHKAFEAYLGRTIPFDSLRQGPVGGVMWPEHHPSPAENVDMYKIPVPVPAPIIVVKNTPQATVEIKWNRVAEDFSHDRLMSTLAGYNLYRSDAGMGPWTLLDSFEVGAVNGEVLYVYEDEDEEFRLGESKYYAVTSNDENGYESGKTNITFHTKNVSSVDELRKVYAVPNPFVGESGFTGMGQEYAIGFYGLPEKCTIKIYSYAGQLVETIEHDADGFSKAWFQVSRNRQDIASGIYIYVVTTPEGDQTTGKLVIIK